ncbi:ethanolamine ammonia-lyase subunit EutC [Dyadobacter sp. CY323]|uniref:ethanolamine ammonia-lyase subunit EutC n=1 Tax=Dyadobacter sp. CY323 TaxID=2907302 RepID=UPI001F2D04EE|nr:ethanolamine ammonia-lyase subunit EutC [Dyadobacter sp. CY323]MCE6989863.1 ethanolamine ammonia-lyase subunit EutC [Dyadobacter sp. CY323]
MNKILKTNIEPDEWQSLKAYTDARIALGKTGVSIPVAASMAFKLAHAHAKDAVYSSLDQSKLIDLLKEIHQPVAALHSQAANRDIYLQRPDLGRRLADDSVRKLHQLLAQPCDLCIILADGLSASAINENAWPVVNLLVQTAKSMNFSLSAISLVEHARVAIADEIGSLLKAKLSIIFIGERPGLSSFDSMGAYITYAPSPGLTDERRNCISNIRQNGLSAALAVDKIMYLVREAFRLQTTGVSLKDNDIGQPTQLPTGGPSNGMIIHPTAGSNLPVNE